MSYSVIVELRDLYGPALDKLDRKTVAVVGALQSNLDRINTNKAQKDVQGFSQKLSVLKNDLMNTIPGISLLTNPVVATSAVLGIATNSAMSFEKGMAKVNATLQKSPEELAKIQNELIAVSRNSTVDLDKVPDAFNKIVSVVGDTDKSMMIFKRSLVVAKAEVSDMNTVALAGANIMANLGEVNEKTVARAYDVLSKTAHAGAVELDQIAQYVPKLLPKAQQLGLGFEQLGGAVAYMTAKGQTMENTTTLIENMMTALSTKEKLAGFEKIGVKIFDLQGKMRPLLAISTDLNKTLAGKSDAQKTKLLENIGLDAQAASAFALLSNDVATLEAKMKEVANSAGEVDRTLAKTGNTANTLTEFTNNLKATMLNLGALVLPVVNTGLSSLNDLFGWVRDSSTELSVALGIVGGAWLVYQAITNGTAIVQGAFNAVLGITNLLMAMNPAVAVALAIVGIATALVLAYKNISWFRTAVDATFSFAKWIVMGVYDSVIWLIDAIKSGLQWLGILSGEDEKTQKKIADRQKKNVAAVNAGKGIFEGFNSATKPSKEQQEINKILDKDVKGKDYFTDAGNNHKGLGLPKGNVEGDSKQIKNITFVITNLVGKIEIYATSVKESASEIREQMTNVIVDAARDAELVVG